MTLRIYTKTGDQGETGLFGGERVAKDHVRVEAYGGVDELNAHLGLARAYLAGHSALTEVDTNLARIQATLFELGGDLATPPARKKRPSGVTQDDIAFLEQDIDAMEAQLAPLKSFILPGGSTISAALHVARVVCRRAERRCVSLLHAEPGTAAIDITYLNRLSDHLFVLARYVNHCLGAPDIQWHPRT